MLSGEIALKNNHYYYYVFPHTSTQYVKCGSTSQKYKLFNILVLRIDRTLFKIPVHLDTFFKHLQFESSMKVYKIIVIMVIFKCYFSGELIALS